MVQRCCWAASRLRARATSTHPPCLTQVHPNSEMCRTEIFGPVAAIQTFTDTDDVIALANDTEWGLVGYVFTQDSTGPSMCAKHSKSG